MRMNTGEGSEAVGRARERLSNGEEMARLSWILETKQKVRSLHNQHVSMNLDY